MVNGMKVSGKYDKEGFSSLGAYMERFKEPKQQVPSVILTSHDKDMLVSIVDAYTNTMNFNMEQSSQVFGPYDVELSSDTFKLKHRESGVTIVQNPIVLALIIGRLNSNLEAKIQLKSL